LVCLRGRPSSPTLDVAKNGMSSLLVCLLLSLLALCCFAQQQGVKVSGFGAEDEPRTLFASPDVSTTYVFPRFPNKKFPSGEEVEIMLGFANNGAHEFNITRIEASYNYPLDYNYYIQNFTTLHYNWVVAKPSTQVSVSYRFRPDALLEPRDFGLVASVFYRDAVTGTNYTSVFFNSTIDNVEPSTGVDTQLFFTYLAGVAVLGLVGFVLYRVLGNWAKRHTIRGKLESGTKDQVDDDWLVGTAADPALRKKKDQNKKGQQYKNLNVRNKTNHQRNTLPSQRSTSGDKCTTPSR